MLKPKGDRVVVKKIAAEDEVKTDAGIILTGDAVEALNRQPIGMVVAVGPDVTRICSYCGEKECVCSADQIEHARRAYPSLVRYAPAVQVGEMVLYQRHGGTEVKIEGVDLLVFKESEILAGIEEDAPAT